MHEYSIVADLVQQVERIAGDHGVTPDCGCVQRLHIAIGDLSGVEIPLLETAYVTFRERTLCADADLVIRRVEAEWACPGCGGRPKEGGFLRCETCGLPARLVAGDEIVLERIEMELPDRSEMEAA